MGEERLERELREYFRAEAKKVVPPPAWWDGAISRLGGQEKRSRPARPALWKLLAVPLSVFLLIVLVGSLFGGVGGMSPPPPPAPVVVSDGAGGAFFVWLDNPHYQDEDRIRVQHADAQGNLLWGEEGKQVASGNFGKPCAASDGDGGVIIAWGSSNGSCVIRVGSGGGTIWTLEAIGTGSVAGMVQDGSGGAILLLDDGGRIYAQRVSAGGALLWGEEGVLITAAEDAYGGISVAGDGRGGGVVVWWQQAGEDVEVCAQRLSAEGETAWVDGGVVVATIRQARDSRTQVISDGLGSFIVAWDTDSGGRDGLVRVQKLDEHGSPLWAKLGVALKGGSRPQLAADGAGGAIVTWRDRSRIWNGEVFAQRVSADGNMLWPRDGVWLWDIPADYPDTSGILDSSVIGDGTGGAIIVWTGYSEPAGHKNAIVYAQRLGSDGQRLWSGEEVCDNPDLQFQGYSSVISDGQGGIIIGSRAGESSISQTDSVYAQRIDAEGSRLWGEGGLEVYKVRSALTVQFIFAGAVLATILVLIGLFRRNRVAVVFTAIMPVLLGIAGLFSMLLVAGPLGYAYGWAYIPDTVVNRLAALLVPLLALVIGGLGISRKAVTLWVMVPVMVFCALVAAITGLVFVF